MDRFTQEFARSRVASHVEAARLAGELFDKDETPGWPPEPLEQDEADFVAAFVRAHGQPPAECDLEDFWAAFNDAAVEAVGAARSDVAL